MSGQFKHEEGDNDAMIQFQFELKLPTAELTFWSTKHNQLFSWTFPT